MILRSIIISLLLLLACKSYSQNYVLPDGEYMDTTAVHDTTCKEYRIWYYSVGGKYPKSSITLVKEAQLFLKDKKSVYKGNGYITFRYRIDCSGHKMKRTQVLQTDEQYASYHFNKELVNQLYLFLNTLDKWNVAETAKGKSYSYNSFLTFKIKNGEVVNIIP